MRLQPKDKACEDIKDVQAMVAERIRDWSHNHKNSLPKHIVYYRDGVSDSVRTSILDNDTYTDQTIAILSGQRK